MSSFKALVSDKLSEAGVAILKETPGIDVDVKTGMSPDELLKVIGEYDALIIRSATKVTADVIKAAEKLRVIGRAGIGVDNVDTPAASAKGVVVMNTPGGNTVTTAEHAIAMMMSVCRNIPSATASVKESKWEKSKFLGVELSCKTLGIIGIGRIGSLVAKRAHGLEMNVVAYDPYISEEAADKLGVKLLSLEELYKTADVISLHTQLTDETKGMIGKEAFGKVKKGVFIINCARGGLIDESALAEAVKSGIVAGAALDVYETEPPSSDNPLLGLERVVMTPHLGASTGEALENVSVAVANQVADYLVRGVIQNAVNVPSVDPEELSVVRPYMELGERIGSFLAQTSKGGLKRIKVTYMGELAEINTKPVTQATVKGVLETSVGKTVNLVNAPYLAESRGIVVQSGTSSAKRNFAALMQVTIETDKEKRQAEGTVFIGSEPRLVKLENVLIETKLAGDMLVFSNNDKPGVIGAIGGLLGEKKINIANFQLGRDKEGGRAIAIVSIDAPATSAQIDAMKKIENVIDVMSVKIDE